MLVDIFFKVEKENLSKTTYLGQLEIDNSFLNEFDENEKNRAIEGVITTSLMSNNIEWTPVSEEGVKITYDYKLN